MINCSSLRFTLLVDYARRLELPDPSYTVTEDESTREFTASLDLGSKTFVGRGFTPKEAKGNVAVEALTAINDPRFACFLVALHAQKFGYPTPKLTSEVVNSLYRTTVKIGRAVRTSGFHSRKRDSEVQAAYLLLQDFLEGISSPCSGCSNKRDVPPEQQDSCCKLPEEPPTKKAVPPEQHDSCGKAKPPTTEQHDSRGKAKVLYEEPPTKKAVPPEQQHSRGKGIVIYDVSPTKKAVPPEPQGFCGKAKVLYEEPPTERHVPPEQQDFRSQAKVLYEAAKATGSASSKSPPKSVGELPSSSEHPSSANQLQLSNSPKSPSALPSSEYQIQLPNSPDSPTQRPSSPFQLQLPNSPESRPSSPNQLQLPSQLPSTVPTSPRPFKLSCHELFNFCGCNFIWDV